MAEFGTMKALRALNWFIVALWGTVIREACNMTKDKLHLVNYVIFVSPSQPLLFEWHQTTNPTTMTQLRSISITKGRKPPKCMQFALRFVSYFLCFLWKCFLFHRNLNLPLSQTIAIEFEFKPHTCFESHKSVSNEAGLLLIHHTTKQRCTTNCLAWREKGTTPFNNTLWHVLHALELRLPVPTYAIQHFLLE